MKSTVEEFLHIATAHREQKVPTLDQIKHVINTMPTETDIERRNRALVAFTLLTGARDSYRLNEAEACRPDHQLRPSGLHGK